MAGSDGSLKVVVMRFRDGIRQERWLIAAVATALAAYAATLLLEPPAGELLRPVQLEADDVFSPAELERGAEFRRPQTALTLLALALQVGLLAVLIKRPPALLGRVRSSARAAALVGAGLSLSLGGIALPLDAVVRTRALNVGLSTRSWPGWAFDRLIAASIDAVFAALLAVGVLALIKRLPRFWWMPGSGLALVTAAVLVFAQPVVLDPLFNRFEPLRSGPLRADATALARAAGIRVDSIEVMDASRRTTAVNAYVAGLGTTKRVVLYDNLVRTLPRPEARAILAHELAHQRYGDLGRGLLFVALVAPLAMLAIATFAARLAGNALGSPRSLPALALAFIVVSTSVTWISNRLSRAVEARADAWALQATRDPEGFIAQQRRLVRRNVGDPDPPTVTHSLLSTHPTALERIGAARAFEAMPD